MVVVDGWEFSSEADFPMGNLRLALSHFLTSGMYRPETKMTDSVPTVIIERDVYGSHIIIIIIINES